MSQMLTKYLVYAGGAFLAVLAIIAFNMEGGIIFSGVAALYIGFVMLWVGVKRKTSNISDGSRKFRMIAVGVTAIIAGIAIIVDYIF